MRLKRDKLDAAFSDFIRWRDGWKCRRCGAQFQPPTNGLHCAHIYSRANPTLRVHQDNALALCHGCHSFFTGRPLEFRDWIAATLGEPFVEALKIKYYAKARKLSKGEKELLLQDIRSQIASLRVRLEGLG